MFGAEAIWWLNSILLAGLTHVGLLWMLVGTELKDTTASIKTTIIIETLPAAEKAIFAPEAADADRVEDQTRPDKVESAETTESFGTNDTEEATRISEAENVEGLEENSERLSSNESSDGIQAVDKNDTLSKFSDSEEQLSPANIVEHTSKVRESAETAVIASAQSPINQVVRETDPSPQVGKEKAQSNIEDGGSSFEKPVIVTNAPQKAIGKGVEIKPIATTRQAPTPPNLTTKLGNQVAILAPKPQDIIPAEKITTPSVEATKPVTADSRHPTTVPPKKFEFPDDAKRLAPASTKPAKAVSAKRLAATDDISGQQPAQSSSNGSSVKRLQQVAIASATRAGRVEPDSRYRDLLRFLEEGEVKGCATVLPTIARDGSVSLSGFAADEGLWAGFQQSMSETLRVRLPLEAATVAKAQCRALTFARTQPLYPRFSLDMKLENTELVSGQYLNGKITDVRGRQLHLLVVDDEGLVQQIDSFLQPKIGSYSFAVPLSVSGQAVRTAQMLIALAVKRPLSSISSDNATGADQFFSAISEELAETNQDADIAIVSFYLRSASAD